MSGTKYQPQDTVNLIHPETKGEFSCPYESYEAVWKDRGWKIQTAAKPAN